METLTTCRRRLKTGKRAGFLCNALVKNGGRYCLRHRRKTVSPGIPVIPVMPVAAEYLLSGGSKREHRSNYLPRAGFSAMYT